MVHGDAHPVKVLWNDGLVALLDWEWVRLGGAELAIEPFLYRGYESEPSMMGDSQQIIGRLAKAHPDAFAVPDLERRMWLIELASTLRDLLLQPPDQPQYQLPADHPLRRLRQIATDSHHLGRILPRCP